MKFLHISDLHYHKDSRKNEAKDAMFEFIHRSYPDHKILCSGDCTDDGLLKQYDNAYAQLRRFEGRVFVCPGNHDFGGAGNLFSAQRARHFDEKLSHPLNQGGSFISDNAPVVNVIYDGPDAALVIALDSNLETCSPFDFACGEIGREQLEGLDAVLSSREIMHMKKIVMLHHHPFVHNNPFMQLQDAQDFARVVYGRVDVLVFGHKHDTDIWTNRWGIPYTLAADDSPGKRVAREISISGGEVSVRDVPIA